MTTPNETIKLKHLTEDETRMIRGMAKYWNEVSKRDDQSPLQNELGDIYRMLGTSILWILSDYVNNRPQE